MTDPKLHHYVPQFHLRRFADSTGKIWAWDRNRNRVFRTATGNLAAETQFYRLGEFEKLGLDPLTLEKQLADLEREVARITDQWLEWLPSADPGQPIPIPAANRELVALFIAVQFLRTADTRAILADFVRVESGQAVSEEESRRVHLELLWDEELVRGLSTRLASCTWVFAVNLSETPFMTSDNPVAFRTPDNRRWVKSGITAAGVYAVYPMSPLVAMYAHPKDPPFDALAKFDGCRSPVSVTSEMVESENSGQVFMATRFVIADRDAFDGARAFAATIGTDLHAGPPRIDG